MSKGKRYKSVLGMVWGLSGSLLFKLSFTWIIIKKRLTPNPQEAR